jgi:hypothetical protein
MRRFTGGYMRQRWPLCECGNRGICGNRHCESAHVDQTGSSAHSFPCCMDRWTSCRRRRSSGASGHTSPSSASTARPSFGWEALIASSGCRITQCSSAWLPLRSCRQQSSESERDGIVKTRPSQSAAGNPEKQHRGLKSRVLCRRRDFRFENLRFERERTAAERRPYLFTD